MRRSKRSFSQPNLKAQIQEALFLYNETIAVYYIWRKFQEKGIKINKTDTIKTISAPKMNLIRSNVELSQTIFREMKREHGLEYLKMLDDSGKVHLDTNFIKLVIKYGYSYAYAVTYLHRGLHDINKSTGKRDSRWTPVVSGG